MLFGAHIVSYTAPVAGAPDPLLPMTRSMIEVTHFRYICF